MRSNPLRPFRPNWRNQTWIVTAESIVDQANERGIDGLYGWGPPSVANVVRCSYDLKHFLVSLVRPCFCNPVQTFIRRCCRVTPQPLPDGVRRSKFAPINFGRRAAPGETFWPTSDFAKPLHGIRRSFGDMDRINLPSNKMIPGAKRLSGLEACG